MKDNNVKELLTRALLKRARGYLIKERTDEYVIVDGEKKLVKSKVVTKHSPPDVTACKVLLQLEEPDLNFADMTDEQLNAEKMRLISLLSQMDAENDSDT
ncbi:MAG: hypothetical protein K2M64_01620 [Clostridia bacterium]|nr:hypothetical protein [Clostridia bacterium]